MSRLVDNVSVVTALALHAGVAIAMSSVRPPEARRPTSVEVEVRRTPPPPPKVETPPEPPPPEPERKIQPKVVKAPPPTPTPAPNREPPKEPPKEVKPVFGVTMESTTEGDSNVAMPVGNTTMIDPSKSGKSTGPVTPLPAAPPGPAKPEYRPAADIYIKTLPEIDSEACARTVSYPAEAEQLGIEGEVKLRVSLDESGKVHDIKVLSGLGHGLDQAAVNALKHRCRFKPAIGTDGKPVAYVIQSYIWNFELPR